MNHRPYLTESVLPLMTSYQTPIIQRYARFSSDLQTIKAKGILAFNHRPNPV
jgi:hypothetical protein